MSNLIKLVDVEGFKMTPDEWEELKDTFISGKVHEEQIIYDMSVIIRDTLIDIDKYLDVDDYEVDTSSEFTKKLADSFINNIVTIAVLEDDEIQVSRFYELICGINKPHKELVVVTMINSALSRCFVLEDCLSH